MKRRFICLLAAWVLIGPLHAGVVYEIEVKDHESSPPRTTEMSADRDNLKMGILAGGPGAGGEMIFHSKRREMVVIDHENKSYFVMDEAAMKSMAGQVGQAMSQVEEMLKNVPESQRAAIEEMMKKSRPTTAPKTDKPSIDVKQAGGGEEKSGYPCVKYEVWVGGEKTNDLFVTPWTNIVGGEEVAGTFAAMASFFADMVDAFAQAGIPGMDSANAFSYMSKLDGFPVVTREFKDGSLDGETTLRSARRETLDPAAFEPPAGYKRQEMFRGR